MKKQSFLTGAIILMIANAVSKILGAVLKIPLTYILKPEGMAVYSVAFEVYIMFLSFIISGLPFAVSKLCADAWSVGKTRRAHKLVTVSTGLLTVIGALGSVILYVAAPFFALAMKEEKAVYAIRMIAPSVFFVAVGTGYKSYFQGVSRMVPVAVSQVAESTIKLAAGYGLALVFLGRGIEQTAGGAIMGVTVGEIVATAILGAAYIFGHGRRETKTDSESTPGILKDIMALALPLLCASVVSNALGIADTTLTRTRLLDAGLTPDRARYLYGAYAGYALTVFHLPVGILATLGVSILPVIAGAYASGSSQKAQTAANMGIRISSILSVPCAVGMYMLSGEILTLLFRDSASAGMLRVVAPCAVVMCAAQMSAAILQSAGKIMLPFYNSLAGMAIKLFCGYILIGRPEVNIYGSAISAIAAYTVMAALNFISLHKSLKIKLDLTAIAVKPIVCGAAMIGFLYVLLPRLANAGELIRLVTAGGLSCLVYALMLFLTGAVSIKELRAMF